MVLHKANKSPSATALAILCIEEMGKLEVVTRLLSCLDGEVSKFWKLFRTHKSKNHQWLYPHLQAANATAEEIARFKDPKSKRSEEHTSELQSLMRISYAVFCLKK